MQTLIYYKLKSKINCMQTFSHQIITNYELNKIFSNLVLFYDKLVFYGTYHYHHKMIKMKTELSNHGDAYSRSETLLIK